MTLLAGLAVTRFLRGEPLTFHARPDDNGAVEPGAVAPTSGRLIAK
jgi:hypothetical protein